MSPAAEDFVSIRRATLADAEFLSSFGAKLFEETFRGTCSQQDMENQLSSYYSVAQISSELTDENDRFYLLSEREVVCGYSRLKPSTAPQQVMGDQPAIELKRLYFSSHAQGRGLAKRLLLFNFELARSLGFRRVFLSVWEHNQRAKSFYRKMGFEDTGIGNPFPIGNTPQMDYWFIRDL